MAKFLDALLLQPLSLIWAVLVILTLWRLAQRKWRAAAGPALLAVVIYAIGATKLPAHLLATLERPYAGVTAASLAPADAVVVLGGMSGYSSNDVFNLNLGPPADRMVAAMELVRLKKGRALVIGGGGPPVGSPKPAEGELLQRWATNWSVFRAPVFLLGRCAHTREEALRAKALAEQQGWKKLILVTSASHMRRAAAVFERAGLVVTPFACDFEGMGSLEQEDPHFRPLPGPGGFEGLAAYLHEIVGWWVYRWRGWL